MKLYRSELERGFQDQLFEVPAETLNLDGIQIAGDAINCILNTESTPSGFQISGDIKLDYMESCDRCLADFQDHHVTELKLVLTNKRELIDDSELDVIWFPSSAESVDISENLRTLVLLEEDVKHLCREDCNGLCSQCGFNKNEESCSCADSQTETPLEALKELTH